MSDLLVQAWDEAAEGYDAYFTPRFLPAILAAQAEIVSRRMTLPPGPVLVPCCGPGAELRWLADALPGRSIVGLDLSPGMIALAARAAAERSGVWTELLDCRKLSARYAKTAAAVVSCFGLQQIPEPDVTIGDWMRAVAPRGALSVVFWPRSGGDDGPGAIIRRLMESRIPQGDDSWQDRLVGAVESAGGRVASDRLVPVPMRHESAAAFFDAMTTSGPMRVHRLRHGEPFIQEMRAEFLATAAKGPFEQAAVARLIVADKSSLR